MYVLGCQANFQAFALKHENDFIITEGPITSPNPFPYAQTISINVNIITFVRTDSSHTPIHKRV